MTPMPNYEIEGIVEDVGETQTFSSGFSKRRLVLNVSSANSKYPNIIAFTAIKDGCSRLDELRKGNKVRLRFTIDGRIWEGPKGRNYFTDLTIRELASESNATAPKRPAADNPAEEPDVDLPF